MKKKLGVIGLSEGNGHPYSWSAIINGYNPELMADCGFSAIPKYLALREFPKDAIQNACVTHIWCQDVNISKKISKTCNIENIVLQPQEMFGCIDGLLLARDDAENHKKFARPFLANGIPVYIDKPLALNLEEAKKILELEVYRGQIFSCSALRYANEMKVTEAVIRKLGKIQSIEARVPKCWNKYAVHVIEPLLGFVGYDQQPVKTAEVQIVSGKRISIKFKNGIESHITATGKPDDVISLTVTGFDGSQCFTFNDPFSAFKSALEEFIDGITEKKSKISHASMLEVVKIIQFGSQ